MEDLKNSFRQLQKISSDGQQMKKISKIQIKFHIVISKYSFIFRSKLCNFKFKIDGLSEIRGVIYGKCTQPLRKGYNKKL